MNRTTTTLKRTDEDSYAVILDGKTVGSVTKGWSRLGGVGWTYTNDVSGDGKISTVLTLITRKLAVQLLLRRIASGNTDNARYLRRIKTQRKTDNS